VAESGKTDNDHDNDISNGWSTFTAAAVQAAAATLTRDR